MKLYDLAYVDGHLAGREYLLGHFTVADGYLYTVTRWAAPLKLDIFGLANLDAFMTRMSRVRRCSRPGRGPARLRAGVARGSRKHGSLMNAPLHAARRFALLFALGLLTACSTTRPWVNQPLPPSAQAESLRPLKPMLPVSAPSGSPQVVAAVALSGGGARAAAFGLGVLEELKATRLQLDGASTTLLDEVGLISGVSGGSVLATYYAAFGDEVFTRFEPDFLNADFQSGLIGYALSPASLYRLTSPWYGRSNALAERLDPVFRGLTFGDLKARPRGPRLLVTATDLTTGAPFEFTPEQFALICSDLDSVPLSFAAAASSSVPLLLSPMGVRNYAGSCPQSTQTVEPATGSHTLSARLLRTIANSYEDSQARPYLHLVDCFDDARLAGAVAERRAQVADSRLQHRFGDELMAPYRVEQGVLRQQPARLAG